MNTHNNKESFYLAQAATIARYALDFACSQRKIKNLQVFDNFISVLQRYARGEATLEDFKKAEREAKFAIVLEFWEKASTEKEKNSVLQRKRCTQC